MLLARARCLLLAPAALLLVSLVGSASVRAQATTAAPAATAPTATAPTAADQPPAGLAADEEARMRFELGRRYYDTGRFTDAAREFAEAHRLSGRAELLYNLFLAYRDAGDDAHAAETLRNYIPSLEAGERRTQLEARLRVLEQRLATGGAGDSGTAGSGAEGAGGSGAGGAAETGSGSTGGGASGGGAGEGSGAAGAGAGGGGGLGVVPWVVVGVGGALVVGSIITGVLALDARASLDRMCSPDGSCPAGYEGTQSSGQALAITTDILWVTGAIAVGTGVVLAIVDMGSGASSSETASVSGGCTEQGCYVAARGSF